MLAILFHLFGIVLPFFAIGLAVGIIWHVMCLLLKIPSFLLKATTVPEEGAVPEE